MKTKYVVTFCGFETLVVHVHGQCDELHLWLPCHAQIFMWKHGIHKALIPDIF